MDAAKKTPAVRKLDVKKLATLAMITCLAYVVMLVSKLMPSVNDFLDFDFKDVVICIGGFVYGPAAAAAESRRRATAVMDAAAPGAPSPRPPPRS